MAEIASTSQAHDQQSEIRDVFADMVLHLSDILSPSKKLTWKKLLTALDPLLPHVLQSDDITYIGDIFEKLKAKGKIDPMKGSFEKLYDALLKVNVEAANEVEKTSVKIKALMSEGPPPVKKLKPGDVDLIKGRDAGLTAMIETTKLTTIDETSKPQVISIQALEDAKEMIRKNSIVLIKGASGDGKTLMCYQLLKWLMDDDNQDTRLSKDPVQLYNMDNWDSIVKPNAQLAVYIDNVSGEIAAELKKREVSIKSTFRGKLSNRSNCLILNVRDEIFKSTQLPSCELFNQKIIDLRGKNCIQITEKQLILESYVPEIKTLSGGKESEIIKLAPDLGFPQCCHSFKYVPGLKEEGVNFFKQPFYFIEKTLENLTKEHSSALLFLFLNDGRVKKGDLDPKNSESVDKKNLDEAFQGIKLDHADKIRSLKKSLDEMFGSLVAKTKYPFGYDSIYKFCHDSVQDTVALLYGKDTKIGFIENSPRNFLHYISTSEDTANKIVISSSSEDEYKRLVRECMYKRLVRECESDVRRNRKHLVGEFGSDAHRLSDYIATLDVWADTLFLQGFISWLCGQNYDNNLVKCALLNGACSIGLEDRVSYLLSVGATPDEETPFSIVKGGSVQVLRKLLKYAVIPKAMVRKSRSSYDIYRINVLDEACSFERGEMVTLLCDRYPHLIHGYKKFRFRYSASTLHLVSMTGNCGIFQTVERTVLKSLYRDKEQRECESENGHVVHRSCVCGKHMSQLIDEGGRTVLHYNCMRGHRELSLYLCKSYPALTTAVDNNEKTVLHYSYVKGHRELSLELCKLYPALTTAEDNDGKTILHYSCEKGERELSLELCALCPALITAVDTGGKTILHYSCEMGDRELSLKLCTLCADLITAVDNNGKTIIHYSCMRGHRKLSLELCKLYPALTTAVDNKGKTILHYSCVRGHSELSLELCKSFSALTTAVDNYRMTVLHHSCVYGHRELSLELCKLYPALTTAVDHYRRTVLHHSCSGGHRELSLELCTLYPALTIAVDNDGYHCLHYIARRTTDVDWFTECESHVKQYLETTGRKYDITTILTNDGKSVLDWAKERRERMRKWGEFENLLYDHLVTLFAELKY